MAVARSASKRLSAPLSRNTREAVTGAAKPLISTAPEILVVEQPAGQPPRARCDHHRPRLGQRLQPRREVRRLADHRLLLRRALADQIADDDEPGGDPDPHLQPHLGRGVEPRHRLDHAERGPHRPLGVVLVGPRIAEIGEHAVAHVLGDKPAGALDDRGDAAVIGAEDRAQILRVEPRRQRRRADQIAEHHGQLPPLGLGGGRCGGYGRGGQLIGSGRRQSAFAQRGDRLEQLQARTERQAERRQMGLGQLRQHLGIDLILAECRLVTLQPQAAKPRRNLHATLPGVALSLLCIF